MDMNSWTYSIEVYGRTFYFHISLLTHYISYIDTKLLSNQREFKYQRGETYDCRNFIYTKKGFQCSIIEGLYGGPSYMHIEGRGVYYNLTLVFPLCHLNYPV